MNCRQAERLLSDERDGRLPEHAARAIAAHLEHCPACRKRRDAFRGIGTDLRGLPMTAPSSGRARDAIALWESEQKAGVSPPWQRLPTQPAWAVMTSVIALLAVAGSALMKWNRSTNPPIANSQEAPQKPVRQVVKRVRPALVVPSSRRQEETATRAASAGAMRRSPQRVVPSPPGTREDPARHSASLTAPARRVQDDLANINADPAKALGHWSQLPGDEVAALEARLRREVRGGDNFITIPFPRIASGDNRVVAEAVAAYQREAAVVDARLVRKVSVGVKATALSDLCSQLRDETGIDLRAGRRVADDKVTLFCTDRPLRDIMRQISMLFGFTWERGGEEGAYRYTLTQTLRAQLLEEELRNRDRNEALLALDKEMYLLSSARRV